MTNYEIMEFRVTMQSLIEKLRIFRVFFLCQKPSAEEISLRSEVLANVSYYLYQEGSVAIML